jgi:tRNA dimethylallyltransferase
MGLPEVPRSDAGIRSRLEEELTELGSAAMRARLGRIDPASAERIPESDTYRTLRALEVYEQTGSPLSSFKREGGVRRDFSVTVFELTRARSELHQRIKLRVEKMFERGLRVEVERLVAGGGAADWPAMRAIGYREFFDTAGCVRPRNQDAEIMNEIKTATRRYAKRQITFCNQFLNRVQMHADDVAGVLAVVRRAVAALDSV